MFENSSHKPKAKPFVKAGIRKDGFIQVEQRENRIRRDKRLGARGVKGLSIIRQPEDQGNKGFQQKKVTSIIVFRDYIQIRQSTNQLHQSLRENKKMKCWVYHKTFTFFDYNKI